MATFLNIRTTDAGQALLADVHTGIEELMITHVAFGCGIWEDSDHSTMSMTTLKSEVMRVAPSGGKQAGGEAELTCVLTNSALETGFALTEIGIIAQRKDKTEVLYMADAVPSARSTWISSKNEYRVEIPVALRIVCSSTSDVEIRVKSTSPVTNEDLDNHNTADNAHADIRQELASHTHGWTNITGKPTKFLAEAHTHTSSEVGLGNLPNAKDDSVTSNRSDVLATNKAVKTAYDKGVQALNEAGKKAAASHNHNSAYYTQAQVDAMMSLSGVPLGGCLWFDGTVNSAGRPLNPTTNQPMLAFGVCDGRTYTAPDGRKVTTVNAKDRFIVTAGGTYSVGATGGASSVTISSSQMPSHKHKNGVANDTERIYVFGTSTSGMPGQATSNPIEAGGGATYQGYTQTIGSSSSHENRPPYLGLFLIKRL